MRLDIISDIHLTQFRDHGSKFVAEWLPNSPTLIIAGDVAEFHWWLRSFQHVKTICEKYKHVLFIAGNHDYYGTTFAKGDARFRELEVMLGNFYFLERQILQLEGINFAGCSLWFKEDPLSWPYERYLSDFQLIHEIKPEVYKRNKESVEFLSGLENIDVVITHHMFSNKSVHPKYEGDPLNAFFLCEIDDIFLKLSPKVGIHGHTHKYFDYMLGDTRVLCNPRGYPNENLFGAEGYQALTIEI